MASKNRPVPEDLIIEILSRLPVKSLIRFTSVCKPWSSIIMSDSFVKKQLSCPSNKDVYVLFAELYSERSFSLLLYQTFKPEKRMLELTLPYTLYECRPWLIDSCDGIICLEIEQADDAQAIALWNPALMQFKVILVKDNKGGLLRASISFDPITKDYKVVCFIAYVLQCNEKSVDALKVYSLRKGSWRTVGAGDLSRVSKYNKAFLSYCSSSDGNMVSWVGVSMAGSDCLFLKWMLMSFNVSNETFLETPMPILPPESDIRSPQYDLTHLETMRGCSVFGWRSSNPRTMDLWNLREYGNARSWTKMLSITLVPDLLKMFEWSCFFWNGSELLFVRKLMETTGTQLFLDAYDPKDRRVRSLGELEATWMVMYKESLVSIK
ncbi:hypothetical protein Droror1_Dr00009958 [Drosera rotundifolia]